MRNPWVLRPLYLLLLACSIATADPNSISYLYKVYEWQGGNTTRFTIKSSNEVVKIDSSVVQFRGSRYKNDEAICQRTDGQLIIIRPFGDTNWIDIKSGDTIFVKSEHRKAKFIPIPSGYSVYVGNWKADFGNFINSTYPNMFSFEKGQDIIRMEEKFIAQIFRQPVSIDSVIIDQDTLLGRTSVLKHFHLRVLPTRVLSPTSILSIVEQKNSGYLLTQNDYFRVRSGMSAYLINNSVAFTEDSYKQYLKILSSYVVYPAPTQTIDSGSGLPIGIGMALIRPPQFMRTTFLNSPIDVISFFTYSIGSIYYWEVSREGDLPPKLRESYPYRIEMMKIADCTTPF